MNAPEPLPSWASHLRDHYASGSTNTFLLYGNVADRFVFSREGKSRLGTLDEFITATLLDRFSIIFTYDVGNGIRVTKGAKLWQELTAHSETLGSFPAKNPGASIEYLTHAARYLANLSRTGATPHWAACIIRDTQLIASNQGAGIYHPELSPTVMLMRDWSREELLTSSHFAAFLLAENLNDLHPLLAFNPRAVNIQVPLPQKEQILGLLRHCRETLPGKSSAVETPEQLESMAGALSGASFNVIESTLRVRNHRGESFTSDDFTAAKKAMIEREAGGLIEFLAPKQTLDDVQGQVFVKEILRRDFALWRKGQIDTCPMGYLICGPVGTGKTYMVRCLSGEAGIPVVRIKNFRDKWVGSSEGNLEKIFRLLKALGRCFVFIDEADQALGRRDSGDSSGVSNRVYSLFAEEMSNTDNRGKIVWVLASSRPDLIEVDLKRPGRIDVRIPLFPTLTEEESFTLIAALCARSQMVLTADSATTFGTPLPTLLTAGTADAIAREARKLRDYKGCANDDALREILREYSPPIALHILEEQIAIAVREASDLRFVPDAYRKYRTQI